MDAHWPDIARLVLLLALPLLLRWLTRRDGSAEADARRRQPDQIDVDRVDRRLGRQHQ